MQYAPIYACILRLVYCHECSSCALDIMDPSKNVDVYSYIKESGESLICTNRCHIIVSTDAIIFLILTVVFFALLMLILRIRVNVCVTPLEHITHVGNGLSRTGILLNLALSHICV